MKPTDKQHQRLIRSCRDLRGSKACHTASQLYKTNISREDMSKLISAAEDQELSDKRFNRMITAYFHKGSGTVFEETDVDKIH